MVDTPHGAEQTDEGRGRPHRGQEGQALLDARLGAGYSHAALVDLLYTNLAGVAPTPEVQGLYTAALADGTHTPLSLATLAAEHEINLANIGYAALQEQGLVYV